MDWLRESRNANKDKFFDAGEITKDQQRAWYNRYQESNTDRMFIIYTKTGDKIGTIALYNLEPGYRVAEVGRVLLLEQFRGKGYAEEAVGIILDLAFNQLRLWKIRVSTHTDNLDAIAVYARAGFKTLTRPITILEKVNPDYNPRKPIKLESYDDMSESFEGQHTNVR